MPPSKSDIYRPLNICSGAFGWDDVYGKPVCTLSIVHYLKEGHEASQYPELTCSLHSWMSILFWKKSQSFQLSEHVTTNEESDPEKVQLYLDSLPDKPFKKGGPLWEMISLPNYSNSKYGTKSVLVWRIHHSLADGLACLSLYNEFFDGNSSEKEMKFLKPSKITWNIWTCLQLIFVTPTETIFRALQSMGSNLLSHSSEMKESFDNEGIDKPSREMVRCQNLVAMDMAKLKGISRRTRTNITSLLSAGVAGAVRKILKERGANLGRDATAIYVLPSIFGHPGNLTNNMYARSDVSSGLESLAVVRPNFPPKNFETLILSCTFYCGTRRYGPSGRTAWRVSLHVSPPSLRACATPGFGVCPQNPDDPDYPQNPGKTTLYGFSKAKPRGFPCHVRIAVPMRMPLSEGKIDQRLTQITDEFRHLFNSPVLVGGVAFNRGLGLISGTFRKYFFLLNYGTLFHSNFSTFKENRYELCGNPVERVVPIAGLLQGSCFIGIINISYNGKMGVAITADKTIFSGPDELERVIDHVISEINEIGEINMMKNEGEMSLV
ncbi:O-acyltransferase WSD [Folsomia candida]|uniref:O-acyltransferase WSD n=1 Tax=Folsomia candida TaxID=158441 RepID=A0A226DMQ1_FOLCA|nr:O-acyltransferase WSD [Folsomia candida]